MRTVDAAGLSIGASAPTRIMGVVNVSPESPYDPSVYTDAVEAASFIDGLIEAGADIVDVGLASANKRVRPLTAEEELDRLDLAADAINSTSNDAVYSIETRYHEVAEAAIDRGFEMVNDVCGFADEKLPTVCRDHDIAVVKMASPPDLSSPGALESVEAIHSALTRHGFTDKTIIDPAFGGWSDTKTLEDDRETFMRLEEFHAYERPILVSINRKNFLRRLADRSTEEALPVSIAATSLAVERGVSVIRTHDVGPTRDAAIIGDRLGRDRLTFGGPGDITVTELDTQPHDALWYQLSTRGIDRARAADWSWRAFALTGVETDRDWLVERLRSCGVTVETGDTLVIAGSVRSIRRLDTIIDELPSTVAPAIEAIVEAST